MNPTRVIPLWPAGCPHAQNGEPQPPQLEIWSPAPPPPKAHAAVIVCPVGGYHRRAPHEGETVARWPVTCQHGRTG